LDYQGFKKVNLSNLVNLRFRRFENRPDQPETVAKCHTGPKLDTGKVLGEGLEVLDHLIRVLLTLSTLTAGRATVFWAAGDPQNPDPRLACSGRPLDDTRDRVVAHRTLPCGSQVLLYNPRNGRSTIAIVADRGPRRAMVDLSKPTARQLRIGLGGHVLMTVLPR